MFDERSPRVSLIKALFFVLLLCGSLYAGRLARIHVVDGTESCSDEHCVDVGLGGGQTIYTVDGTESCSDEHCVDVGSLDGEKGVHVVDGTESCSDEHCVDVGSLETPTRFI